VGVSRGVQLFERGASTARPAPPGEEINQIVCDALQLPQAVAEKIEQTM